MACFLVTGGAGFIGSHFCEDALKHGWCDRLVVVDALTYAGHMKNLDEIRSDQRFKFVKMDIAGADAASDLSRLIESEHPDVIVHFAAESHVDRSLSDPALFLRTNVLGTFYLLHAVHEGQKFIYISTDEVYGSLGRVGTFTENTPLSPRSPYAASKAGADLLAQAYHSTFNLDVRVVRCSNNFGPRQFPEKFIPQTIIFALLDRSIPVYGDGSNVRDWIHVQDFSEGIEAVISNGSPGGVYNFGGASERTNVDVAKQILKLLNKPAALIQFVKDRKGHDFRYSMDFSKSARSLGWMPKIPFDVGLKNTVAWYENNQTFWKDLMSGEYRRFFETYYGQKL